MAVGLSPILLLLAPLLSLPSFDLLEDLLLPLESDKAIMIINTIIKNPVTTLFFASAALIDTTNPLNPNASFKQRLRKLYKPEPMLLIHLKN